jgi:hypothetical protein
VSLYDLQSLDAVDAGGHRRVADPVPSNLSVTLCDSPILPDAVRASED